MAQQYLISLSGGSGPSVTTDAGAAFALSTVSDEDGRLDGYETFNLDRGAGVETFQNRFDSNGFEGMGANSFNVTYPNGTTETITQTVYWAYVSDASGNFYMLAKFNTVEGAAAFGDALSAGGTIDIVTGGYVSGHWVNDLYGNTAVACFTRNTLIRTENGEIAVEDLSVGDSVLTLDRGYQPIRWIGSRKLDSIDLAANPKLCPVKITAGALGNGLPEHDLSVSRQHRMLTSSKAALNITGEDGVLIAAIRLTEHEQIQIDTSAKDVEYFHILLDDHNVIYANGAPSESFYICKLSLELMPSEAQTEITTLFPELLSMDHEQVPVRHIPNRRMQKDIIAQQIGAKTVFLGM